MLFSPAYLDAKTYREWADLCRTLGTGSGLPRHLPKPETLPEQWGYRPHHPAPYIHQSHVAPNSARRLAGELVSPTASFRSVIINDAGAVDEWGNPYTVVPGSMIDRDAYRRAELRRMAIEQEAVQARVNRFFPGFRPAHTSPFGPENTRFRSFSTEPYFPDRCGAIAFVTHDKTTWNDYTLDRRPNMR